jgi:hypothetical protein
MEPFKFSFDEAEGRLVSLATLYILPFSIAIPAATR